MTRKKHKKLKISKRRRKSKLRKNPKTKRKMIEMYFRQIKEQ